MTWLSLKLFFQKSWVWIVLGVSVLLTVLLFFLSSRSKKKPLVQTIQVQQETHQREVEILENSYQQERERREELQREYERTMAELEAKYAERQEEIGRTERRRVREIVTEADGDVDRLSQQLASEFGLTYRGQK